MLHGTLMAVPPSFSIAAATMAQASALRLETTTLAPACASVSAMARPMPRDDPVTIAVRPLRSNCFMSGSAIAACQRPSSTLHLSYAGRGSGGSMFLSSRREAPTGGKFCRRHSAEIASAPRASRADHARLGRISHCFKGLLIAFGSGPALASKDRHCKRSKAVMNIDVVSSAAADPPATPQAAAPGGGGAVFGQFLDASNSAAAAPQPNAAVRPIATTATGKSSLANSPAAAKAGGHGDRAAESGDQPNLDSLVPCAGGLVLPGPAAFVPVIVPTGTVAPPATSILATADKAQVGAAQIVAGDTAAAASVSSAIATGPKSPNAWQAVVAAANLQTATPAATGQAASAQTTPQGVVNAPADLAISADPTLPPPIAGAAKPSAALAAVANGPSAGTPNNRGAVNAAATVSAQAAALLGRVSVVGAAQSPAATPTGAVGAPLLANSANSVIAATVASDGTAAPISTPQQATPLPPVSGNIDLSAKFSATAIPPHGEVGSPVLAKAKVEPRATAGAADAIVGKPPV